MSKTFYTLRLALLLTGIAAFPAAHADCVSCQIHKQGGTFIGGAITSPAYPATPYYGGYPNYGYGGYPGYGSSYGDGYLKHRCGPEGRCVTTYKGPPGDINYLPRIDRQIRQTRPSRMYINPRPRPEPRN